MRQLLCLTCVLLIAAAADDSKPSHPFAEKGAPAGWVVRVWNDVSKPAPPEAKCMVNDHGQLSTVMRNGQLRMDCSRAEQRRKLHCDSAEEPAGALKGGPRKGHIGFQDLGRDGRVEIRNVSIRVLNAAPSPDAKAK